MNIDIPQRPDNDDKYGALTKIEKEMVVTAVLRKVPNRTAFLWFNPHYAVMAGKPDKNGFSSFHLSEKGEEQSGLFWRYPKVREFRADYERTLEEFFNRNTEVATDDDLEAIDGDALARKILSDLSAMVKNGRIQDYEVLKIVTDILNKYGLLKGSEEKQIAPIRVLMARCKSECNYCFFIETAKAKKMLLDSCDYCKARKIAEEHGFKFDHCTLLEVPAEVVAEFEAKNNVNLMDIINNGQQTRADIEEQFNKLDNNG